MFLLRATTVVLAFACISAHAGKQPDTCLSSHKSLYKWNNFETLNFPRSALKACSAWAASNEKASEASKARAAFLGEQGHKDTLKKSSLQRLGSVFRRPGGFSVPSWAVLGPFVSGKAELDGDPVAAAAHNSTRHPHGITEFTRMDPRVQLPSELTDSGLAGWSQVKAGKMQQLHSSQMRLATYQPAATNFNKLIQQLSSMGVLEFQAWAVAPLLVPVACRHVIHCTGVQTVYLRRSSAGTNETLFVSMEPLIGDVYNSGHAFSSVFLPAGAHELLLPLRAKASATFGCRVQAVQPAATADAALHVEAVKDSMVPDLVLGSRFCGSLVPLGVRNDAPLPQVALGVALDKSPQNLQPEVAFAMKDTQSGKSRLVSITVKEQGSVVPGQRSALKLQLSTPALAPQESTNAQQVMWVDDKAALHFHVVFDSVSGSQPRTTRRVVLPLRRRSLEHSFRCNFAANDGSIQSMSVVAPLPVTGEEGSSGGGGGFTVQAALQHAPLPPPANPYTRSVPILVSLHGTGVSAANQADAYKRKAAGDAEYTFGVPGYWVLAPDRFGAHNWEGPGLHTVWSAVAALEEVTAAFTGSAGPSHSPFQLSHIAGSAHPLPAAGAPPLQSTCQLDVAKWRTSLACLPTADAARVLWAGHSMGGHGAWHALTHAPHVSIGGAPMAGWIKKEEYGDSNAFMQLDATGSAVSPHLRAVLQAASGGQDAAAAIPALGGVGLPLHIRVGRNDNTVSPWFSKRMLRLLRSGAGVGGGVLGGGAAPPNATLELVHGKEHWWWDTASENDGGVLADNVLLRFYEGARGRLSGAALLRHLALFARSSTLAELHGAIAVLWPQQLTVYSDSQDDMLGGWGVRILQRESLLSPATVRLRLQVGEVGEMTLFITTHNVGRFEMCMDAQLWAAGVLFAGSVFVDSQNASSLLQASHGGVAGIMGDGSTMQDIKSSAVLARGSLLGQPWALSAHRAVAGATIAGMWHAPPVIAVPASSHAAHVKMQHGKVLTTQDAALAQMYASALYLANHAVASGDMPLSIVLSSSLQPQCGKRQATIVFRLEQGPPCFDAVATSVNGFRANGGTAGVHSGTVRTVNGAQGGSCVQWAAGTVTGWAALQRLMQPTIPPMVRLACTNYLPGCVAVGAGVHAGGYGDFFAAGWNL